MIHARVPWTFIRRRRGHDFRNELSKEMSKHLAAALRTSTADLLEVADASRRHGVPRFEVQGIHSRVTRKVELPRNIPERLPAQAGPSQHGLPHWEDGVCTGFQIADKKRRLRNALTVAG